jgi:hypothetical protein
MPVSIDCAAQIPARAVLELLELHEDEVPDLDEPVAVFFRRAGRAAPDVIAMVIEDLGAGAAGTGGPIIQKLSLVGMRMIFSSGRPATFFQISRPRHRCDRP